MILTLAFGSSAQESSVSQNIDEITGYIAFINHQTMNAIKVGDALFKSFNKIASYPFAFKECEELSSPFF
jgi:hypothetical protein